MIKNNGIAHISEIHLSKIKYLSELHSQTSQVYMLFATHGEHSLFFNNKLFCSSHKLGANQLGIYQNWSLCF